MTVFDSSVPGSAISSAPDTAAVCDADAVPASVFRAYDIRGIADEELTDATVLQISRAIGSEALAAGIDTLLVGYDGRLSSPALSQALIAGLRSTGCHVIDLGRVPTPVLYFASHKSSCTSGVMLTASHNPANYNGLKIVFRQSSLAADQIQHIRSRVEQQQFAEGQGSYTKLDMKSAYIAEVCARLSVSRSLKVVVDCANAVAGEVAPALFTALGCEVIPLFCEVDGTFPNHHPDPTVASNLTMLSEAVRTNAADIGIAFDGDADRVGVVTNEGEIMNADGILKLLACHIAPAYPGASIVFDVKCSSGLAQLITELGCVPIMHRSGHSFMKQKMLETNAPLGGEFAAHIFIKDRWFGFDDGMYAAARIVEILSQQSQSCAELFRQFPALPCTPEIAIPVAEEHKFGLIDRIMQHANFPDANVITIDGLRVEFNDGWGLIRASNTSPALLLRFEAESEHALTAIQAKFKGLIHKADKSIELLF